MQKNNYMNNTDSTIKYTCPMHPEIISDKPGRCPKCGMALVRSGAKPKPAMHQAENKGLGVLTWQSYVQA
jgi:hypothetical protein